MIKLLMVAELDLPLDASPNEVQDKLDAIRETTSLNEHGMVLYRASGAFRDDRAYGRDVQDKPCKVERI